MLTITILLLLSLVSLLFLLWQCMVNLKRYKLGPADRDVALRLEDTPTISLCIPARNETHALADCLGSAVASDYPKLEIIVLDDCSQDRTSQIIRSFAHDGVRFVKGEAPSEGWLGKNNAYGTLVREARGDYLVFMSVDTRLEPKTLSMLTGYMRSNKLSMVSVLPRRGDGWRASVLFAPLRYFWQIVLPLGINTPTATSLWAVHTDSLAEIGGIAAFKDSIMIENQLASRFFTQSSYHFLIAGEVFKAWYAKKWGSQTETAVRLWYPSLSKNIAYSLLAAAAHLLLFVWPLLCFALAAASGSLQVAGLSAVSIVVSFTLFYLYLRRVQTGAQTVIGTVLLPAIALQEAVLIMTSFYRYKTGRVDWKGRNVCYPVLKRTRY